LVSLLLILTAAGCTQPSLDNSRSAITQAQAPTLPQTPESQISLIKRRIGEGKYQDAVALADSGLRQQAATDPAFAAQIQILKARALSWSGDPQTGLRTLELMPTSSRAPESAAFQEIVRAEALCRLGKNAEGRKSLGKARSLLPTPDQNPALNAEWEFAGARCADLLSQSAENEYQRARQLAHGNDPLLEAGSLINLGVRQLRLEHFDESIDALKQALELEKTLGSPLVEEKISGDLGTAYAEVGDFNTAEAYSRKAEQVAGDLGITDDHVKWLSDVGYMNMRHERMDEAQTYYARALSLAQQQLAKASGPELAATRDITVKILRNLTDWGIQANQLTKAEEYSRQAEALNPQGNDLLDWKLNHARIAVGQNRYADAEQELKQLVEARTYWKVRWLAQSDLASLYDKRSDAAKAELWYRKALDSGLEKSGQLKHQEYKTALLSNLPFYDNYIQFLVRRDQPNRALQIAELGRTRVLAQAAGKGPLAQSPDVWMSGVQSALRRQNKIVLAFWESHAELYSWVITPSQVKQFRQPFPAPEIARLIGAYRKEIDQHRAAADSPAAAQLYDILVRPAEALIPKTSSVIVVGDSELYDVNFEALVVRTPSPHYWIEDVKLENAISVQMAAAAQSQTRREYKRQLLALGAPVQVTKEFPRLPHAQEEITRITAPFPPSAERVLAAESATPDAFFSNHPDEYRYIHFVAHGTRVPLEPLDSAIVLSPDKNQSYKLYARDIAAMKQRLNAEVVTISSCDSAGTRKYSMGGLVGLSWAFARAGAHQVVSALWRVDDTTTPELMDVFYRGLAQGKPASEALREAKLSMLHSRSREQRPYYWATLQLYTGS
jgi:CHAT domain-containing protein